MKILTATMAMVLSIGFSVTAAWAADAAADAKTTATNAAVVNVDWTKSEGTVNRGIFSTQGFMQVYVERDPRVMQTFTLINPEQTQTRLEIYLHEMEPENDNDDPNVFNWDAYRPNNMIRFIKDRKTFEEFAMGELGMEPLALLCYNVEWLKSGKPDNIISDMDEWVEYAAAVVESYNGKKGPNYKNNLKYVEVWNEPNFSNFHIGSMEAYDELFRLTAERIHRDYPGVEVGGPAISHAPGGDPEEWMDHFFKHSAKYADFVSYHHYGPGNEPVDRLVKDVVERTRRFREIPGKENGKIMITELDTWFHGWGKAQHILERQFRFLELDDMISSIHHFCCMEYGEGGRYKFGIVRDQGSVLPGVFWPYWLFRNHIGDKAAIKLEGDRKNDLRVVASHDERDGQTLATTVLHNTSGQPMTLSAKLKFKPLDRDRVLVVDRIAPLFNGPVKAIRVPAGESTYTCEVALGKGEAGALHLQETGKRFFGFRDMNNQETPWINITSSHKELELNESAILKVRVFNPNLKPIGGQIKVFGSIDGWEPELVKGKDIIKSLAFGKSHECTFRITAKTLATEPRFSPYAALITNTRVAFDLKNVAHSIPAYIELKPPYQALITPMVVFATAGETNRVELQITNELSSELEGKLTFEAPADCDVVKAPTAFKVDAKGRKRFALDFTVPATAKPGMLPGKCFVDFKGTRRVLNYRIEVIKSLSTGTPVMLDLAKELNTDSVCYGVNKKDFDIDKLGMFAWPADYLPSDRVARTYGIPFKFADLTDGKKVVLTPDGQKVAVPEDQYTGAVLLGYGHDGKHPGTWTFHYADGTVEKVDSEIPEWCSAAPIGTTAVFEAPYRWIPGGPAPPECQLWMWTLPTNSSKTLKSIEMPKMERAHLFAVTLLAK